MDLDRLMVVSDATRDPRFADNPLVTDDPRLRFYAGQPLRVQMAPELPPIPIGALCVVAPEAREMDEDAQAVLAGLGLAASELIQARVARLAAEDMARDLEQTLAARDRFQRQLQQAERLARVGSWRLSLPDLRTEWSEQVYAIHELPTADSESLVDALRFYPAPDRAMLEEALAKTIGTGASFDVELDFITARGRARRVRAIGELEREHGAPVAVIGAFQDVTDRYEVEQRLRSRADTDELTRIATRRRFNEYCDALLARADTRESPMALALIDLDHFKQVNDRFGHASGDRVLLRAAAALSSNWLANCFAARMGGDELVLLITDPALLADLDTTVLHLLEDLVLPIPDSGGLQTSATIGVCLNPGGVITRGQLMSIADEALYAAKRNGRGTAAIASEGAMRALALPATGSAQPEAKRPSLPENRRLSAA